MRTKPRPEPSRALARLAPVVLWTIVAGGFGIALLSALAIQRDARWLDVLPFLVLSLVAALPTVQLLETQRERFSFSFQIVPIMAAIAVVPYAAPLIGLLSAAVHVLRSRQRRLEKVLFNLAILPLAAGIAASIYLVLPPQTDGFWPVLAALGSVLVFYTSMLAWSA